MVVHEIMHHIGHQKEKEGRILIECFSAYQWIRNICITHSYLKNTGLKMDPNLKVGPILRLPKRGCRLDDHQTVAFGKHFEI